MEARPATIADLDAVFCSLAPRMAAEYSRAGVSVDEAKAMICEAVVDGRGHSLMVGDQVVALLVWQELPDQIQTSFAAKELFFSPRNALFCRTHMRRIQAELGNKFVLSISYSDHPRTSRWFQWLGFEEQEGEGESRHFWLRPIPGVA